MGCAPIPSMSSITNTHPARLDRAKTSLKDAHAPVHQNRFPRLVLGLVALVPAISFVAALVSDGATQMGFAYLNLLWTGLLAIVFSGWMIRSGRFRLEQKIAWVFGFVVAPPITLPLYWYRHVWNAPEAQVTHD